MSEERDETDEGQDEAGAPAQNSAVVRGRPFQKGVSPNPGGKPKAWAEFSKRLEDLDETAFKALQEALTDPNGKVRMMALSLFLDRRFGKAPFTVTDEEGRGLRIGVIVLPSTNSGEGEP